MRVHERCIVCGRASEMEILSKSNCVGMRQYLSATGIPREWR